MNKLMTAFSNAFKATLLRKQRPSNGSGRVVVENTYPVRAGHPYSRLRDITELVKYKNRSHTAHQGKNECARRVRKMANGADCGQFNFMDDARG